MTNQHPITPPPELVQQWADMLACRSDQAVFTQAAQWGADEELKALCQLLYADLSVLLTLSDVRAARRPKPLSLRKQAYDALDTYIYGEPHPRDKERTYNTIRRALEALPND